MDPVSAEVLCAILQLPESITVEAVYPSKTQLTVQIACVRESAACPLCQQSSERIHSRYGRRVADVPCGGRHRCELKRFKQRWKASVEPIFG